METLDLRKIFSRAELETLNEIARDMGISPEEAAVSLALAELDKNPSLSVPKCPESVRRNAEIFYFPHKLVCE